jgi:hypothetical protein
MAALIFLGLAILLILIGRIMLMVATFGVSIWWGLGVFLPFGPILFRLSYPDLASPSRLVRLAALPCLFMYFLIGPPANSSAFYRYKVKGDRPPHPVGYAIETTATTKSSSSFADTQLSLSQRMQANAAEFDRLQRWREALQLRKRDLLHSDVAGNRDYNLELARYNDAVQKANDEKNALAAAK